MQQRPAAAAKICPEFLGRARVLPVNSVYLGARILAIVTRAW